MSETINILGKLLDESAIKKAENEVFEEEIITRTEQLHRDYALARSSYALYWAQNKFKWSPKAFYQVLLLGCFDKLYTYPKNYPIKAFRGLPIKRFAWRIGRQSGKTEVIALGALYLALVKPIKYKKKFPVRDKSKVTPENPKGIVIREKQYTRGANIILASADADKAKTVFDRVMKFLNECPEYCMAMDQGIIVVKKNPFPQIEFHVDGWSQPANLVFRGPGANGQAARSKTFDYKLYDEADYMPASFFAAEKATEINAGDEALTVLSSTPSGRRAHFFKACFENDTPILLSDGTIKNIEDIEVDDVVFNRFAEPARVTKIMNRPYTGNMHSVWYMGSEVPIKATPNHRVMAVKKENHFCNYCEQMLWNPSNECLIPSLHDGVQKPEAQYYPIEELYPGDFLAIPLNLKQCYDLSKFDNLAINFGHVDDKFIYLPITNNEFKIKSLSVYNLEVENDHSYVANFIGVANCTDPEWGYKEFWFASWENPKYDEIQDRSFKAELNTTQYEHEIMADWGTVDMGVFNWLVFEKVFAYKYKNDNKESPEYRLLSLTPESLHAIGNDLSGWLNRRFPSKKSGCKYWFGADLGYSADPSEFVVFEEWNGVMKMVLRIHMEHVTYDIQADLIALLDNYYQFKMLGMDAGSNGTAVAQILMSKRTGWNKFALHNFDKRLIPIPFGGRLVVDKINGKEVTAPAKEAMTNMIIYHAERNLLQMPGLEFDDSIENQFRNHTYSTGSGGQIVYSKGTVSPDHVIDAVRTAFYAKTASNFTKYQKLPTSSLSRVRQW